MLGGGVAIAYRVLRDIWRCVYEWRAFQAEENSKCKGPGEGSCVFKEASMVGAEWVDEVREKLGIQII